MRIVAWEEWKPRWAPEYVAARYTARDDGTEGMPEEQRIECRCGQCGAEWKGSCVSGNARAHIQRFCMVHNHGATFPEGK